MTSQFQAIFAAAEALPDGERALLVERLLETLSADGDADAAEELSEEEFLAELHRREQEMAAGGDKGISWSELKKTDMFSHPQ